MCVDPIEGNGGSGRHGIVNMEMSGGGEWTILNHGLWFAIRGLIRHYAKEISLQDLVSGGESMRTLMLSILKSLYAVVGLVGMFTQRLRQNAVSSTECILALHLHMAWRRSSSTCG